MQLATNLQPHQPSWQVPGLVCFSVDAAAVQPEPGCCLFLKARECSSVPISLVTGAPVQQPHEPSPLPDESVLSLDPTQHATLALLLAQPDTCVAAIFPEASVDSRQALTLRLTQSTVLLALPAPSSSSTTSAEVESARTVRAVDCVSAANADQGADVAEAGKHASSQNCDGGAQARLTGCGEDGIVAGAVQDISKSSAGARQHAIVTLRCASERMLRVRVARPLGVSDPLAGAMPGHEVVFCGTVSAAAAGANAEWDFNWHAPTHEECPQASRLEGATAAWPAIRAKREPPGQRIAVNLSMCLGLLGSHFLLPETSLLGLQDPKAARACVRIAGVLTRVSGVTCRMRCSECGCVNAAPDIAAATRLEQENAQSGACDAVEEPPLKQQRRLSGQADATKPSARTAQVPSWHCLIVCMLHVFATLHVYTCHDSADTA